jgi:hypothetical protein
LDSLGRQKPPSWNRCRVRDRVEQSNRRFKEDHDDVRSGGEMSLLEGAMPAPFQLEQPELHPRFLKRRVLLALDGRQLTPELQRVALKCCVQWTRRLDILLINPPQAPTFLLGGLLLKLEHSGIDYRLNSCDGEYGCEVARYLQRLPGVGLVIAHALTEIRHEMRLRTLLLDPLHRDRRYIRLGEPDRLQRLSDDV